MSDFVMGIKADCDTHDTSPDKQESLAWGKMTFI
jgi:hypothetical protein